MSLHSASEYTDNPFEQPKEGRDPRPVIVFEGVSKNFQIKHTHSMKETVIAAFKRKKISSDFHALSDLSFTVPEGQSIALMGRNGSGKSTTLKLLSGVMPPDSGWIRTRGRIAGLLEVGAGFHPDLTGRANVYLNAAILGMSKAETDAVFDDILEFSEIGQFIDTEVKFYSSGMYSRLGFAVAVHTNPDTLLVDEVLSVGDAAFREKCMRRMEELQQRGTTMFIVSHNARDVQRLCERGIVLDHGNVIFDGPIEEAVKYVRPEAEEHYEYEVPDDFRKYFLDNDKSYGPPLGPVREFTANGGGRVQEFEDGMVTVSTAPGDLRGSVRGLRKGAFLAAYKRSGGPEGPWGLIVGKPEGNFEEFETRTMEFQNGIAGYSLDEGLSFRINS